MAILINRIKGLYTSPDDKIKSHTKLIFSELYYSTAKWKILETHHV